MEKEPNQRFREKSALILGKLACAEDLLDMIKETTARVETGAQELLAEIKEKQETGQG